MNTPRSAALGAATIMLAACGGLSAEERRVADLCVENASGDKDECACIARELGDILDKDEMAQLADLAEGDMGDQMVAMMDMGMDPDAMRTMQRLSNAGERAERACRG